MANFVLMLPLDAPREKDATRRGFSSIRALSRNVEEVDRLMELHGHAGGYGRGRRHRLEELNKASFVMITAFWEAYCEDLATEALAFLIAKTSNPLTLPEPLKKQIAMEVKKSPHEMEPWHLAGEGWKSFLASRAERMTEERNWRLNTPKSANIDEHFRLALGVPRISDSWRYSKKHKAQWSRDRLDHYVTVRGAIAYRGANADSSVTKIQVEGYAKLLVKISVATVAAVNKHLEAASGVSPEPFWD